MACKTVKSTPFVFFSGIDNLRPFQEDFQVFL